MRPSHWNAEKWQLDEDKLTFIILARNHVLDTEINGLPDLSPTEVVLPTDPRVVALPMIGDVNLFLKGTPPHLRPRTSDRPPTQSVQEDDGDNFEAEVEIMIAGTSSSLLLARL